MRLIHLICTLGDWLEAILLICGAGLAAIALLLFA